MIVGTVMKNDEVQYLAESEGKRKTFSRKALLESHELFEEALKYYNGEMIKMVSNLCVM